MRVSDFATGGFHNLVICQNGWVFSWGRGIFGQLGTGEFKNFAIPKEVEFKEPVKVVSVSAGGNHSFFLTDNGKLLSCGKGAHG